jgi:bacteriocin biosynthesis cyclodehydratase domain-containing protein
MLELFELLSQRGMLIDGSFSKVDDWFACAMEYVRQRDLHSTQLSHSREYRPVAVGTGWIRGIADDVIKQLPFGSDAPTMRLVCSDHFDVEFFLEENQKALAQSEPLTFAYLDDYSLCMGPFVLPRTSACFQCYESRVTANALFPTERAEFSAQERELRRIGKSRPSAMFEGILRAVLYRHVIGAAGGAVTLTRPGTVERFHAADLKGRGQDVLRDPRCRACAPSGPAQAIRSLI